jgi:L-lactate dehydrogenase complex protein LldG
MVTASLVDRFIAGAVSAGAEVFRAHDLRAAMAAAARLIEDERIRTILVSPSLREAAEEAGLDARMPGAAADIAAVEAGIVRADFGAAETGTLVRLDSGDEEKLLWTLPPICICLLESRTIVPDLQSLASVLSGHLARTGRPGPQVSFVTGPSRTADIEGQLAIGVQGPARLVIGLIGGQGL